MIRAVSVASVFFQGSELLKNSKDTGAKVLPAALGVALKKA